MPPSVVHLSVSVNLEIETVSYLLGCSEPSRHEGLPRGMTSIVYGVSIGVGRGGQILKIIIYYLNNYK
jgi:hypothetical protein